MWNKGSTEKPKVIARSVDICQKCGSKMTCLFAFYICDKCEPAKPSAPPPKHYDPAKTAVKFKPSFPNYPVNPYGGISLNVPPTVGTTWYTHSTKPGKSMVGGYKATKDIIELRNRLMTKAAKDGKPRFIYAITDGKFDPNDDSYLEPDPSDPNTGELMMDVAVDFFEKIDP